MIIITDAHVSKNKGNHASFFKMLEAFEKNDKDLIFLGDIFDLWIALPRYEEDIHQEFIAWCRRQKKRRTIGYVEGNHEFYLPNESAQAFTWHSRDAWQEDGAGILFVHGDEINQKDKKYLTFKRVVRSQFVKLLIRYLPFGPKLVGLIKDGLKLTNTDFRSSLPTEEIELYAESKFADGVDTIFVGHFHQEYIYRGRELKSLYTLPDWFSTQKVTVYHRQQKKIEWVHWEEL